MIDGLKPYPAYKPSGVPWLGEVPEHWEVSRLKGLLTRNDSGVWGNNFDEAGTVILRSTEQTIDGGWRIANPAKILLPPAQRDAALLAPGDLVVTKSSGSPAHIGKTSLVSSNVAALGCCFSNFMQRLRPGKRLDSAFLWRLLNAPVGREQLVFQATTTTGLGNLNGTILGECRIGLPPLPEQAAIVRFLDHADRRIRRYIRAKQKLVKLLEELKAAIIHRAVTGQIDVRTGQPYPRYKPSGVEWLGDVPEDWEVAPFKRRVGFQEGPGIMAADFRDEGVPLLRISCLQGQVATLAGCNFLDPETVRRRWSHFAVRQGDYLLSASASTGNVVLATDQVSGAIPYTGILRLWPISDRAFMPYVRLYMRCRPFQDQINAAKSGVAIEHFGPTHLKRMQIALPPVAEQRAIVDFIEAAVAPFASVAARTANDIALLREYRTRLIADVVTGKLDVREAAARLPEEAEEPDPIDEAEALGGASEESAGDGLDPEPEEVQA